MQGDATQSYDSDGEALAANDAEYDAERYKQVLFACALEDDLDQLPAGDQTQIGEKG